MTTPGEREVVVRAERVCAGYDGAATIVDVDLEIRRGEIWALVGGNGAGKTTFLRVVLGLRLPSSGTIWRHPVWASRAHTGFVPQRCDWRPTLPTTVREFVSLGLIGSAASRREEGEHVAWALERIGLAALADQSFATLSGGERQRAVVARALVRRPTLLLLDEPTAALDLPLEDELLQTLAELHREGVTILLVVHDLGVARRIATHAALFRGGRVTNGRASETLAPARIAELFGRFPSLLGAPS